MQYMEKKYQFERLDVLAFAKAQGVIEQSMTLAEMPRLALEAATGMPASQVAVDWRAAGVMRSDAATGDVPWLLCEAQVELPMQCQRCLQPVDVAVETSQWFRFVATEEEADKEDEEALEDVMSLEEPLNVLRLVEDDLLMALPSVVMHEDCQPPVVLQARTPDFTLTRSGKPNPFAKLAELAVTPLTKGDEKAD